jgi:hypothetical protein
MDEPPHINPPKSRGGVGHLDKWSFADAPGLQRIGNRIVTDQSAKAGKSKNKGGRRKGDAKPAAVIARYEKIQECLNYRRRATRSRRSRRP